MTYAEATQYLFEKTANYEKQGTAGYKPGLQNMLALDEHFAHPHQHFLCIHVAGTNGKGSVSHTLAAALQKAGYRVGLYTSPHLLDFSERIRVDGEPISHERVVSFVESEQQYIEKLKPSFFEIATALAFLYFREQNVDIAVVEVGLGGRLDSTNIITPILSVITNISLDHTQLLGSTLGQIAAEKAGIMKRGVTCIVGEATVATRPVFEHEALLRGSRIVFAEDSPQIVQADMLADGSGMSYTTADGRCFSGELTGDYQAHNANTVLCALAELQRQGIVGADSMTAEALDDIFMSVGRLTGLMARWQRVGERPAIVCDTGHNEGAWRYLGPRLEQQKCRQLRIVYGVMADKAVDNILPLLPRRAVYYWTQGHSARALDATLLKEKAHAAGLTGEAFPTVEAAFRAATADAAADDFIFIGGSTYVVADAMIKNSFS